MDSPSLALLLVLILVSGVDAISSAVQEYKLTHVIATKNSLNKKLVFIKNQFKKLEIVSYVMSSGHNNSFDFSEKKGSLHRSALMSFPYTKTPIKALIFRFWNSQIY
ncbi:MAG: hypothetical protein ACOYLT_04530 [Flavobacterium sp.]|uniref:hypothetical protein n=1 Tax=Flavobacterium sp. TaxID=239 RepID=UPI003BD70398